MENNTQPEQQQANEVLHYKCPNCDGPLAFGIESQKWECHFCGSDFAPAEMEKFSVQQGQGEAQPAWDAQSEGYEEGGAVAYSCPSCGGSVVTEPNTAATFCPYCHSPTIIAAQLSGEYRPAKLIPFQKTKEQALEALHKMCKRTPFLPKVFKSAVEKGEVTGMYVPYWLFSGQYNAMLHARATRVRTWSDRNYRYTKTDHYRVERGAFVPLHKVPVDASSRMDDALMDALEPFDYGQLADFSMQYLSGHMAESYDVDAQVCGAKYDQRAIATLRETLSGMVQGYTTVSGHNLQHSCAGREVLYAMLPVWTLMIPYKGKTYTFAMNGQTGKIVGKLPSDKGKAAMWFGIFTAIGTALLTIGGMLL